MSKQGCSWAFPSASKLKRHSAKHLGLRKWECHVCGKAFMRSEHLKGHLITHSGSRPFTCPVEGKELQFTVANFNYVLIYFAFLSHYSLLLENDITKIKRGLVGVKWMFMLSLACFRMCHKLHCQEQPLCTPDQTQ